VWSLPPWLTGRCSASRRIVTSVVSRIGIASTSSGRRTVATVVPAVVQLAASPRAASRKPSTWLPESPMKTRALPPGRRLNGRNPPQANPSERASTSTRSFGCTVTASIAKYAQATVARVAARPSMLSSRLKALVIPTSHTIAIAVATTSFAISSTRRPLATAMPAAPNCAASFATGPRCRRSSRRPAAKRRMHPPTIPASCQLASTAPAATASSTPARSPHVMPTPPNVGVARACQRSPVGTATRRSPSEDRSSAHRTTDATGRAAIVTAAVMSVG